MEREAESFVWGDSSWVGKVPERFVEAFMVTVEFFDLKDVPAVILYFFCEVGLCGRVRFAVKTGEKESSFQVLFNWAEIDFGANVCGSVVCDFEIRVPSAEKEMD